MAPPPEGTPPNPRRASRPPHADYALRRLRVRGAALAGSTRRAQLFRRRCIDLEGLRIDHDAVELRRRLRGHVALAHVVANLFDRPLERVAVAATTARADFEGVAGLELRHQHLGVGEIAFPLSADAQLHRVAGAVEAAVEPPWPAMGALALIVDHHIRARAHHALDPEPAAATAGAAGIGHQRIALHHDGKLELGLLVRAVVGIAVVDANRAGDAVLRHLGAPAAAQRSEAADEELGGAV